MSAPNDATVVIDGFAGLNNTVAPHLIGDKQLAIADNVRFDDRGVAIRRGGFVRRGEFGDTFGAIFGVYSNKAGVQQLVYAYQGGTPNNIIFSNDFGVTLSYIIALGNSNPWGLQYLDKWYMGSSSATVREWNGTTATILGASPVSKLGAVHKDRLFVTGITGVTDGDSTIKWSDPLNFASWPAANTLDISTGDGDNITAFATLNDVLYIFKNFSTWALYVQGTNKTDWMLRNISTKLGCSNQGLVTGGKKFVEVDGVLYLINQEGFYTFDGNNFRSIGNSVVDRASLRQLKSNHVAELEDNIIFLIDTNIMYVYNRTTGAWSRWLYKYDGVTLTGNGIVSIFGFRDPNATGVGNSGLYLVGATSAVPLADRALLRLSTGVPTTYQDNGVNTTYRVRSKQFQLARATNYARIKRLWAELKGYGKLYYLHDAAQTAGVLAYDYAGNADKRLIQGSVAGIGRTRGIAIEVTDATNNPAEVYQLGCTFARKRIAQTRVVT